MKIDSNFVARPWRWDWVAAIAAGLALAMLVGAVSITQQMIANREELELVEQRLARVSERLAAQPSVDMPGEPERRALAERVASLNAQAAPKGWTTAKLAIWLESEMPQDVQLVSLHHKSRDGEALLVAESASANSLTAFLQRLEREPGFAEVLLAKQGGRSAEHNQLRFEIRVKLAS